MGAQESAAKMGVNQEPAHKGSPWGSIIDQVYMHNTNLIEVPISLKNPMVL